MLNREALLNCHSKASRYEVQFENPSYSLGRDYGAGFIFGEMKWTIKSFLTIKK